MRMYVCMNAQLKNEGAFNMNATNFFFFNLLPCSAVLYILLCSTTIVPVVHRTKYRFHLSVTIYSGKLG